jgi:hypothetical protein
MHLSDAEAMTNRRQALMSAWVLGGVLAIAPAALSEDMVEEVAAPMAEEVVSPMPAESAIMAASSSGKVSTLLF